MIYRYIYKITCTAGSFKDKFYFGQHKTKKLNDGYKGSGTLLRDYYKKHPNDYIKEIIAFYNTQEEINIAEHNIIELYIGTINCLNIRHGGTVGELSEETKKKMSNSHKGKTSNFKGHKHPLEALKKISEYNKGKSFSEETRIKLSAALKGKQNFKGKHHSEEFKKRMSDINKGKTLSEETKKKLSDSAKGRIPWNKGKTNLNIQYRQMVKDNEKPIFVNMNDLEYYINLGYHKGRK